MTRPGAASYCPRCRAPTAHTWRRRPGRVQVLLLAAAALLTVGLYVLAWREARRAAVGPAGGAGVLYYALPGALGLLVAGAVLRHCPYAAVCQRCGRRRLLLRPPTLRGED